MASSSTAFYLKDSGFHVRNVPKEWNDWNLFEIFERFGRVGYCRVSSGGHDATAQLGFINMLSVDAADAVRKNLSDGFLNGGDFSLKVLDQKNVGSAHLPAFSPSKLSSSPKSNHPVLLSSSWLPLNKDVEVEVVDYLPSSSVADDLFAVSLIRINDPAVAAKYSAMYEKINSYAQLTPFDTELPIGYDGLYRETAKSAQRVRRIAVNRLYLLDVGRIVNYEKAKCFQLPAVFQSLPTRVSLCGIDGLKWMAAAIPSFDKIRDVVRKWAQMENATLHAMALGFTGSINMINLFCGNSVLAERLTRKGACEYLPRHLQPKYVYSREMLMEHSKTATKVSNEPDVKELLRKIDGIKSMLRDVQI